MKEKHTPGPWVAVPPDSVREWAIEAPNAPREQSGAVCEVVGTSEWGGVWREPDARLIAAAPRLLAALKAVQPFLADLRYFGDPAVRDPIIAEISYAILDAEGTT